MVVLRRPGGLRLAVPYPAIRAVIEQMNDRTRTIYVTVRVDDDVPVLAASDEFADDRPVIDKNGCITIEIEAGYRWKDVMRWIEEDGF